MPNGSRSSSRSRSPPDSRGQTAQPSDYLFPRPTNASTPLQQPTFIPLPRRPANAPTTVRLPPSAPSAMTAQNPNLPRLPQPGGNRVALPLTPGTYQRIAPVPTASMTAPARDPTPGRAAAGGKDVTQVRPSVPSTTLPVQPRPLPRVNATTMSAAPPTTRAYSTATAPLISTGTIGAPVNPAGFAAFKAKTSPGSPQLAARQGTTSQVPTTFPPLQTTFQPPQTTVQPLQSRSIQAASGQQAPSTPPARVNIRPELQQLIETSKARHSHPDTWTWSSLNDIMSHLPRFPAAPKLCFIERLDFVGRNVDGGQKYDNGRRNGTAIFSFKLTTTDGKVLHHIGAIDTTPWQNYEGDETVRGIEAYWEAANRSKDRRSGTEYQGQGQVIAKILRVVLWRDRHGTPRIGLKCTYLGPRDRSGGAQASGSGSKAV